MTERREQAYCQACDWQLRYHGMGLPLWPEKHVWTCGCGVWLR